MNDLSRRSFLGRSTLAAAGAAGAVAVSSLATGEDGAAGPAGARVVDDREVLAEPADSHTPVVLHIDDAGTGAISAYVGHRHVEFTDRALVARVQGLEA
jgi:nitrous oxide reductase